MPRTSTISETVRSLNERIRALEGRQRSVSHAIVSTGSGVIDQWLPDKGLRRGTLVEWLTSRSGSGAATLALLAAREAVHHGGTLVVIDGNRSFYPPAVLPWGLELEQLVIVRPETKADDAWAWHQALRSPAVAAVWGWPHIQDEQTLRRWQLAAESSGALGLLLRPEKARHQPSWAEVRLLVQACAVRRPPGDPYRRRLRVELLRARGTFAGGVAEIELDEEAGQVLEQEFSHGSQTMRPGRLHLAAQLAHPTPRRRSHRA